MHQIYGLVYCFALFIRLYSFTTLSNLLRKYYINFKIRTFGNHQIIINRKNGLLKTKVL